MYLAGGRSRKKVIVLLGPSGCGKTTFCLKRNVGQLPRHAQSMFLSTGDELRKGNCISPWQKSNVTEIKEYCHKMICNTFVDFKESTKHELILDCVKDLNDAEFVATQANINGLEITRALLFDIDEEQLKQNWQSRAENKDMLRMVLDSPHEYYLKWRREAVDMINYYTKLNLLSKIPGIDLQIWNRNEDKSFYDYPICLPPNNLQFMLLDSKRIQNVFQKLLSILNIYQFQFALPASFVHSNRDVNWIANPARYYVTVKADGVRCLLLKTQDGAYVITRRNEIYPCHIEDDQLPDNTVLDGELLPSTFISEIQAKISPCQLKNNVFLVFDVLALSGDVLWKWPFSIRRECLDKLPIRKDIVDLMKQASVSDQFLPEDMSYDDGKMLTVHCAIKGHRPSTPDDIQRCLQSAFPYPFDGLIFTPDKAYVFGRDPLMFKWQNEDDLHCDLQLDPAGNESDSSDVFKCRWNATKSSWDALFVRYDKDAPDSVETVAHLEKICQQPFTKENLLSNLAQHRSIMNVTGISAGDHPANSLSFDELFLKIEDLVKVGKVDKIVDSATGLEIFTYHRSTASFSDPIVRLSRGLVLHPPSKTVVTRPFVRFEFFEDAGSRDPNEIVEATIKYDGSLGIAFLWNKEVLVTTKRRMDSKQAIWAKQWIKDHCNLSMFQAGYTYLFEIIYQNNTVIVSYFFEGLVLLAINDEEGRELSYNTMLHFARATGFFMVTPRITAPYSEVLWYCGGIESSEERTTSPNLPSSTSGAMPVNKKRQEGWVIKFSDGSRQKIVYNWWKNASKLAQIVHPRVVRSLLRHGKIKEVFENAPNHIRVEIRRMVQAIGGKFEETLHLVESCLKRSRSEDLFMITEDRWKEKSNHNDLDEFTISIKDDDPNKDSLRQLVSELKPYRHVVNKRPLLEYPPVSITMQTFHHNSSPKVNLSPFFDSSKLNFLRLPILDFIPPTSLDLEGYELSENFRQTWCKGWKNLTMTAHWQVVQRVLQGFTSFPLLLHMPVEILIRILHLLDHSSLTSLAKVCVHLRQVIKSCRSQLLYKKFENFEYELSEDESWTINYRDFYDPENEVYIYHDSDGYLQCG